MTIQTHFSLCFIKRNNLIKFACLNLPRIYETLDRKYKENTKDESDSSFESNLDKDKTKPCLLVDIGCNVNLKFVFELTLIANFSCLSFDDEEKIDLSSKEPIIRCNPIYKHP